MSKETIIAQIEILKWAVKSRKMPHSNIEAMIKNKIENLKIELVDVRLSDIEDKLIGVCNEGKGK